MGSPFEEMAARRLPEIEGLIWEATCDFDFSQGCAVVKLSGKCGGMEVQTSCPVGKGDRSPEAINDRYVAAIDGCVNSAIAIFRRLLAQPAGEGE